RKGTFKPAVLNHFQTGDDNVLCAWNDESKNTRQSQLRNHGIGWESFLEQCVTHHSAGMGAMCRPYVKTSGADPHAGW
ncbi:MAG: hypothetical protein JJU05_14010, partial [Verrucomicrobia bacterium]|nr:hypothetical protein [Verrucomicrobiota bacterium]